MFQINFATASLIAMIRRSMFRSSPSYLSRSVLLGPIRATRPINGLLYGHNKSVRYLSSDIEKVKRESNADDTDTSASVTGVVDVDKDKEVLLYYDHIYNRSAVAFKFRQYMNFIFPEKNNHEELKKEVIKMSTSDHNPLPPDVNIVDFVPLQRDGGAFVKFCIPADIPPKDIIAKVCANVSEHKAERTHHIAGRFINRFFRSYPDVFHVKGTPWIEDLRRFPSTKIKVKFEGTPLTEEELYLLFRRYGMITDIEPPTKDISYAVVNFMLIRSAISAKNCITGIKLNEGDTVLHLQYVPIKRVNHITQFISSHQRIAIPALLALLATVAVMIFDPIRQFFIEEKIHHKHSIGSYKNNKYIQFLTKPLFIVQGWFCSSYDYIGEVLCRDDVVSNESTLDNAETVDANSLWKERNEKIKQIKLWIYENVNTFIIVKGPKGSGKRELVIDNALMGDEVLRQKILYVDCDSILKARSDNKFLEQLADQLGYFPLFSWVNSISQFVDLGVQGLTGQKSGLSESKETQVKNMFLLTTQAVRQVALEDFNNYQKEMEKKRRRQEQYKRTHPEQEVKIEEVMKEEEYLQLHPETKPIIVINKFRSQAHGLQDFFCRMISEWSASLIQNNTAHVIFITNDVGSVQELTSALPNQVFKTISLSDATPEGSFHYVMNQLNELRYEKIDKKLIHDCLEPLGGRMLDLLSFIRRVKSGEGAHEALTEIVSQAAEQITTFFLFNSTRSGDADFKSWDPLQVWEILKILSQKESIKFNDLTTTSPLFKSNNETLATLSALEKNDFLTLKREKGLISEITCGRPIYKAAFKYLVEDKDIYKNFEMNYFANLAKLEATKITTFEDELLKLDYKSLNIKGRLSYLVDNIEASNSKILEYENNIKNLKTAKESKSTILGIF